MMMAFGISATTFMKNAAECIVMNLNMIAGSDTDISKDRVNEIIDSMSATDEYKATKKERSALCIDQTPPNATTAEERIGFQLKCMHGMDVVQCGLGIADMASPTLGTLARIAASSVFDKHLKPNSIADTITYNVAKGECTSSEALTLFKELQARIDSNSGSTTERRRRRRDLSDMFAGRKNDMKALMDKMGGEDGMFDKLPMGGDMKKLAMLGGGCNSEHSGAMFNVTEILEEVQATIGPIGEIFDSLPDRARSVGDCVLDKLNYISADGSVDVEALKADVAEEQGPEELKSVAIALFDKCSAEATSSQAFNNCCWENSPFYIMLYSIQSKTTTAQALMQKMRG